MKKIELSLKCSDVTFENLYKQFVDYCKFKNLRQETMRYYSLCYNTFTEYFSPEQTCENIDKTIFYDFIIFLKNRNSSIKDTTINTYLRGIRAILYFGMERGYIPSFKITLMKIDKSIKEPYTDEEIQILLNKPDLKVCSFVEYRSWVAINYFLATGNRVSTALSIKNKDILFSENAILLTKLKNRKQQYIPISKTLCKVLQEYMYYRKGEQEDYLFCTENGEQLSVRALEGAISRYNKSRGVNKTSIHLFRHYFAKNWILNGGDIFRLQRILGHSDLSVVKEYVNIYGNDLQKQFNEFNPLENITKQEGELIRIRR